MTRLRWKLSTICTASVILSALVTVLTGQANAVTGGTVVSAPHSYPFIGYMTIKRPLGGGKVCGATLISRDYALTAAHCLQDAKDGKGKRFSANEATVTFGQTSRSGGGGETRGVSKFIRHPRTDFDAANVNDVALLRLSRPIDTIMPARLAVCGSTPIRSVFSAGWGRGDGVLLDSLREAELADVNVSGELPGTDPYQYRYTTSSGALRLGDSGTGLLGRTPSGNVVLLGVLHKFHYDLASNVQIEKWERVDIGANQTDFIAQNVGFLDVTNACRPRF